MPTPEGMEPSAYPRPEISQATDPVSARHFFVLLISLRHGHPPTTLRPLQLHRGTHNILLLLFISTSTPQTVTVPVLGKAADSLLAQR